VCTSERRRMDILIHVGTCRVLIENKCFGADDQPNQLNDYVRELRTRGCEDLIIVYLSRNGEEPSSQSLSVELRHELEGAGKLYVRQASHFLLAWIDSCQKNCQAEKVRWFLRDFYDFVKTYIAPLDQGAMSMNDYDKAVVLEYALRNQHNLEIALRVGVQFDNLRKELLKRFGDLIVETISKDLTPAWTIKNHGMFGREEGVRIFKSSWNGKYWIELASDKDGGEDFWLGVRDHTQSLRINEECKKRLDASGKSYSPTPEFPWWRPLQRYRNLGSIENLVTLHASDSEILKDTCNQLLDLVRNAECLPADSAAHT